MSRTPGPSKNDWIELKRRRAALPEPILRALVGHWTHAARMEHASVAAFSRFSLQLLAVGAPPAFLEQAHRAALDEIKHAELCFSLASVYAGQSIGPGPLPMSDQALNSWDLLSVAVGTVEEGCVGETVAALQAQASAGVAEDAAVRGVFERIYEDETAHAELAWRFVRWAAGTGGIAVRDALRQAFERTLARHSAESPRASINDRALERHGVLTTETRRELRARIFVEVLQPSITQLFS